MSGQCNAVYNTVVSKGSEIKILTFFLTSTNIIITVALILTVHKCSIILILLLIGIK